MGLNNSIWCFYYRQFVFLIERSIVLYLLHKIILLTNWDYLFCFRYVFGWSWSKKQLTKCGNLCRCSKIFRFVYATRGKTTRKFVNHPFLSIQWCYKNTLRILSQNLYQGVLKVPTSYKRTKAWIIITKRTYSLDNLLSRP